MKQKKQTKPKKKQSKPKKTTYFTPSDDAFWSDVYKTISKMRN